MIGLREIDALPHEANQVGAMAEIRFPLLAEEPLFQTQITAADHLKKELRLKIKAEFSTSSDWAKRRQQITEQARQKKARIRKAALALAGLKAKSLRTKLVW